MLCQPSKIHFGVSSAQALLSRGIWGASLSCSLALGAVPGAAQGLVPHLSKEE